MIRQCAPARRDALRRQFVSVVAAALALSVAACGGGSTEVATASADSSERAGASVTDTSANAESSQTAEDATTSTQPPPAMGTQSEDEEWKSYEANQRGHAAVQSETAEGMNGRYRVVGRNVDGRRVVEVASYDERGWRTVGTVPLPPPDFPFGTNRSVQWGDFTGEGQPDFLLPLDAAQSIGVVISSVDGEWRALPVAGSDGRAAEPYLGVNPRIEDGRLVSDYRICEPSCAEGGTMPVTWRYEDGVLVHSVID